MNKTIGLILSILCISYTSEAQSHITGSLVDSTTYLPVRLATVSLIRESDSVLISYTRTDYQGRYDLESPAPDTYYLLYAHPTFVDYMDSITTTGADIDLGEKNILTRAKMLQEVIVRQRGQIFIKGDTLEYLTDSLRLDETANVEELLKALPGMQVDQNGNITAQGEKVEKVLVDGEEFFGNDPTMVTRNLNANIVDKVQVYEKKSEEAEFTGIDDGEGQKTIDIKLKKDMNKGTFGKVSLNGGLENIWDNALLANTFKGKRKLSLYGVASSNGEAGLTWQDMEKYGLGRQTRFTDGDMMYMTDGGDIVYDGKGLPRNWSAGFNYSNLWNEKHRLSVAGGWRKMDLSRWDSTYTNNFIGEDEFTNYEKNNSYGVKQRFSGSVDYEWDIDSLTEVGAKFNASYGNSRKEENEFFQNINRESSDLLSQNRNDVENHDTSMEYNTQVYIKRKLGKPKRTISGFLNYSKEDNSYHQNKDQNILYGWVPNHSLQNMGGVSNNQTLGASITYTEPLYKENWTLKLTERYTHTIQTTDYTTEAHDISETKFEDIDSLSNDFDFTQRIFTTGFNVQYQDKKLRANIGLDAGFADFERVDYFRPENSQQFDRTNLFPSLNVRYSFSQFSNLSFSYRGNTSQPTLSQLQPNYDFSNPLNIRFGNPDLNQEYNQRISLRGWTYDAFKERSIYGGFNYSNTIDNISSVSAFDPSLGRSITTYQNLNGYHTFAQWAGWHKKFDSSNFSMNAYLSSNYNKYPFVTNGVEGTSASWSIQPSYGIGYAITSRVDLNATLRAQYSSTRSEVRNMDNRYWSFTPAFWATYRPVKFLKFTTSLHYTFRERTPPFTTDFQLLLWDASVSGFLDADRRMELKFTAHDILNQNKGYDRSASSFYVRESYYNNIQRYFMLGFIYNFAIGPMAAKQNPGDEDSQGHW